MQRMVTGATGLIGQQLVEHWLAQQHKVIVVGREVDRINKLFGSRVQAVTWGSLTSAHLKASELVVNLAGASVGGKRWNEAYKNEILSSRIESTTRITNLMLELKDQAPRLFNASAIGIYGLQTQLPDRLPARLDEDTPIAWDVPGDFLAQVGTQWERAAQPAVSQGMPVVFLRFGVVLAKEGGALPQIVKPFKFYVGGPIGTGNQPFSWVALADVIRAIDFLAAQPKAVGAYNIVAPDCVRQAVLAETISQVLNRPDIVKMPAFLLRQMLGKEMTQELLLEGQRVYPKRLLDLGFEFKYPNIAAALRDIL